MFRRLVVVIIRGDLFSHWKKVRMPLRKDEILPDHRALLDWGFNLQGRVPLNWALSAQPLARAAALVHARGQEARRLHATLWGRDASGLPTARSEPLTSAELDLMPDAPLWKVGLMLMGMAIEDMAKGIIVGRNPAKIAEGKMTGVPTSHDLAELVRSCKVPLTDEEVVALRILSEYVRWAGRYPIPMAAEDVVRLTTSQRLRLQDGAYVDYVFSFAQDLIEQLGPVLDAEHSAENAAARIDLANHGR
jgi:hypothetical protein